MDVSVQHPLARVAAYLQSSRALAERIGPFRAGFTAGSTGPWLNYAVPLPGADPTRAEVTALVAAFEQRGLRPRLEYLPGTAPTVEPALRAAGFTVELRPPILVCTPSDRRGGPVPAGIEFGTAAEPGELREVLAVQNEAFGEPAPRTQPAQPPGAANLGGPGRPRPGPPQQRLPAMATDRSAQPGYSQPHEFSSRG